MMSNGPDRRTLLTAMLGTAAVGLSGIPAQAQSDPLPSWNDGTTKQAITAFVARITAEGRPDFVPVDERIATFDNDGTLWIEQPMYVQLAFILDRVKALAPQIRTGRASSRSRRCSKATCRRSPLPARRDLSSSLP